MPEMCDFPHITDPHLTATNYTGVITPTKLEMVVFRAESSTSELVHRRTAIGGLGSLS
jgi:hypothetical protein